MVDPSSAFLSMTAALPTKSRMPIATHDTSLASTEYYSHRQCRPPAQQRGFPAQRHRCLTPIGPSCPPFGHLTGVGLDDPQGPQPARA
jgi:hypothetical protein